MDKHRVYDRMYHRGLEPGWLQLCVMRVAVVAFLRGLDPLGAVRQWRNS